MIIHIAGPSGSGKTTLGRKLNKYKDFMVVDTDDIDDANFKKLYKNNGKFRDSFEGGKDKYWVEEKTKFNLKDLKKLIKSAEKDGMILVIVGISLFGDADPSLFADKKYFIKIGLDLLYKRVMLRTLDDIVKNYKGIRKIIVNEDNVETLDSQIGFNFGIRRCFIDDYFKFEKMEKGFEREFRKKKYKFLSGENIFREIMKE